MNKKSGVSKYQLATAVTPEEGKRWEALCQLAGKSSYQILRESILNNLERNKELIDKYLEEVVEKESRVV